MYVQDSDSAEENNDENEELFIISFHSDFIERHPEYIENLKKNGRKPIADAVENGLGSIKEKEDEIKKLSEERNRNRTDDDTDTSAYW